MFLHKIISTVCVACVDISYLHLLYALRTRLGGADKFSLMIFVDGHHCSMLYSRFVMIACIVVMIPSFPYTVVLQSN